MAREPKELGKQSRTATQPTLSNYRSSNLMIIHTCIRTYIRTLTHIHISVYNGPLGKRDWFNFLPSLLGRTARKTRTGRAKHAAARGRSDALNPRVNGRVLQSEAPEDKRPSSYIAKRPFQTRVLSEEGRVEGKPQVHRIRRRKSSEHLLRALPNELKLTRSVES